MPFTKYYNCTNEDVWSVYSYLTTNLPKLRANSKYLVIKKLKLILFIIFFIYQTSVFSKTTEEIDFNPKYLSGYLSALISKNNQNSGDSVKYFNSSKALINNHEVFLNKYAITL